MSRPARAGRPGTGGDAPPVSAAAVAMLTPQPKPRGTRRHGRFRWRGGAYDSTRHGGCSRDGRQARPSEGPAARDGRFRRPGGGDYSPTKPRRESRDARTERLRQGTLPRRVGPTCRTGRRTCQRAAERERTGSGTEKDTACLLFTGPSWRVFVLMPAGTVAGMG